MFYLKREVGTKLIRIIMIDKIESFLQKNESPNGHLSDAWKSAGDVTQIHVVRVSGSDQRDVIAAFVSGSDVVGHSRKAGDESVARSRLGTFEPISVHKLKSKPSFLPP